MIADAVLDDGLTVISAAPVEVVLTEAAPADRDQALAAALAVIELQFSAPMVVDGGRQVISPTTPVVPSASGVARFWSVIDDVRLLGCTTMVEPVTLVQGVEKTLASLTVKLPGY